MATQTSSICDAPSASSQNISTSNLLEQLAPVPSFHFPYCVPNNDVPNCDGKAIRSNSRILREIVVSAAGNECPFLEDFDAIAAVLESLVSLAGLPSPHIRDLPGLRIAVFDAYASLYAMASNIMDEFATEAAREGFYARA